MKLKYIKDPDLNLIADLLKGWEIRDNGSQIILVNVTGCSKYKYNSLEDFNSEWETLKEPLLYGKLRESLKLWAEYHNVKRLTYLRGATYSVFKFYSQKTNLNIDFEIDVVLPDLKDNKTYDLIELVGE